MQISVWVGYSIGILVFLVAMLVMGLFIKKIDAIPKEKNTLLVTIANVVVFFVILGVMFVGFAFTIIVLIGSETHSIHVIYKDGKAVVQETKEGYSNVFYHDAIWKNTLKNPFEEQLALDVTSKEGKEFSITLEAHTYFVSGDNDPKVEYEQMKKKINGATEKEINEKFDAEELTKMIQEEVKKYTAEELNSKLFLSNKLKEVEKTYNQSHFVQIKLFA